jgi:hypothetical protein
MELLDIENKEVKCSKKVKEYIDWLRIQLSAKSLLAADIEDLIEEMLDSQRTYIQKIESKLDEINRIHL